MVSRLLLLLSWENVVLSNGMMLAQKGALLASEEGRSF